MTGAVASKLYIVAACLANASLFALDPMFIEASAPRHELAGMLAAIAALFVLLGLTRDGIGSSARDPRAVAM